MDFQKNNRLNFLINRLNWLDIKVNQNQTVSNPFQNPPSVKQPIETIKQLVVFPLLYKTLFSKRF